MVFRGTRLPPRRVTKNKYKTVILLSTLVLLYIAGLFTKLVETDFYTDFSYPLNIDIRPYVEQLRQTESSDVTPINVYNYSYISDCKKKCELRNGVEIRVVYLVKSALNNFERRNAIRVTWGYEKRFSDVGVRTLFFLGSSEDAELQSKIEEERVKYNDLVQVNFVDNYYNNTIKTMMAIKWAVRYCGNAKFYFFSDDDMYISTKNLLKFIRNPTEYPAYLQVPVASRDNHERSLKTGASRKLSQVLDFELSDDVELFAGHMFSHSWPRRAMFDKWYVSLSEYPYSRYPPYITAGSYVLSKEALIQFYYGSHFVKHFRFDDIFLGIVAAKVGIRPVHCPEFYFYKKKYNIFDYRYVVASHGYDNPEELIQIWNEQKTAGGA